MTMALREAAALSSWRIAKSETGEWILSGTLARVDLFQVRNKGLLFTAPRDKGFWSWPVLSIDVVGMQLRARLGPPDQ
jgi:hypothetical protein